MRWIKVSIAEQKLWIFEDQKEIFSAIVSTAKNGAGEIKNSYCTPRGWLEIKEKFGEHCPEDAIFVERKWTGEIYHDNLSKKDWILTRVLWLSGLEEGKNCGGKVDTFERFIYIHGTPSCNPMGVPLSKGCIRMRNPDLLKLFDLADIGTKIYIEE